MSILGIFSFFGNYHFWYFPFWEFSLFSNYIFIVQPMGHGCHIHCTIHGPWVMYLLYNPWAMGYIFIVQPMDHGFHIHCTTHGLWVVYPLYSPWAMGCVFIVQSMGHGPEVSQRMLYSP